MNRYLSKSSKQLKPYLNAVYHCCGGRVVMCRSVSNSLTKVESHQGIDKSLKNSGINSVLLNPKPNLIIHCLSVGHSFRMSHTDIKIPDFSQYRRDSTRNPEERNDSSADTRRAFTCLMTGSVGVGAAVVVKVVVHSCVMVLSPARNVLALGKTEFNVSSVPEGKNVTIKWRGKPVFVRHRTQEEISRERALDVSVLRDPETDESRSPSGKWLVVIGICTHLGCIPIPNAGDFNGYYCPCHGSHYDGSGRIRKGPAPLNLEVPPHEFNGDNLTVG